MPDYEELLRGADRPRPLPPELRARLEESLAAGAKPLPERTRQRLESQLRSPVATGRPQGSVADAGALQKSRDGEEGHQDHVIDGARMASRRIMGKWTARIAGAGVAAALVALAAVGATTLFHGGPRSSISASRATTSSVAASNGSLRAAAPSHKAASPSRPAPEAFAPRAMGAPRTAAPPVVAAVSPRKGPSKGGNWVEVTGSSLSGTTAVRFGEVPATRFVVVSAEEVRALAPAHPPGTVNIVVQGQAGRSRLSAADRYSFFR
jgi:hypothetical protein